MSIEELIAKIQPGVTLYGVLLTFAVISFSVGKYFWTHEKEFISENVERLKTLMTSFREAHLEPILSKELRAAIEGAYRGAIQELQNDLYIEKMAPTTGEPRVELVDDAKLKELVSIKSLKERLEHLIKDGDKSISQFPASASGQKFFDDLDHKYKKLQSLSKKYHRACYFCSRTSYSFLIFALLCLIGLLHLIVSWPEFASYIWAFFSVQMLLLGLYYFVRLEINRRGLLRVWEELKLYGEV
jgi:hypothetical protein